MRICNHCKGFVPDESNQCPNCETILEPSKRKGRLSKILYGITLSGAAMTLMACYGQPPPYCQQKCSWKNEEITHCRKKCNENEKKAYLLLLYSSNEKEKSERQTNKTQTSSTTKNNAIDNTESDTNSELPLEP
jgi:hypothetical protein